MKVIFLLIFLSSLLFLFSFLTSAQAYYGPKKIITIRSVVKKYKYIQIDVDNDKTHFYQIPCRTYTYKVTGKPAKDTNWNRREIIFALHKGLINPNYALDIKNTVKMKNEGWCIPTIHVAKQEKGLPTMVIDFQFKAGTIIGFLVASGLPCE